MPLWTTTAAATLFSTYIVSLLPSPPDAHKMHLLLQSGYWLTQNEALKTRFLPPSFLVDNIIF